MTYQLDEINRLMFIILLVMPNNNRRNQNTLHDLLMEIHTINDYALVPLDSTTIITIEHFNNCVLEVTYGILN